MDRLISNSSGRGADENVFEQLYRSKVIQDFGLENHPGHLNCFLNVIVQALWHLKPMKDFMLKFIGTEFNPVQGLVAQPPPTLPFIESIKVTNDIFCKSIAQTMFMNIVLSQEQMVQLSGIRYNIPHFTVVLIRRELFKLYYLSDLFNINEKADAAEALAHILSLLHASQCRHYGCVPSNDKQTWEIDYDLQCDIKTEHGPVKCAIHRCFQIATIQKRKCRCGEQFDQLKSESNFFQMIVSPVAIVQLCDEEISLSVKPQYSSESKLLHIIGQFAKYLQADITQEVDICKNTECEVKRTKIEVYYDLNEAVPEIFAFNQAWQGEVTQAQVIKLLLTLSDTIELGDIFNCSPDADKKLLKMPYRLVGLVCFYGAHYVSFFRELDRPKYSYYEPKWKLYDDTHVEEFYCWKDVIKRCADTVMRPTILFYQRVDKVPDYINKIENYELNDFEKIIERSEQGTVVAEEDIKEQERLLALYSKNRQDKQEETKGEENKEFDKDTFIKQEMKQLKLTAFNDKRVYLHLCEKCQLFIALHDQKCQFCAKENEFYEPNSVIDDEFEHNIKESIKMIYSRAEALENERKQNMINLEKPNEIIDNKLEDSEMTVEHPRDNEGEKEKVQEEARPIDENEWKCENCNQTNFIIYDDVLSSQCFSCTRTNINIYDIIKSYQSQQHKENDQYDQPKSQALSLCGASSRSSAFIQPQRLPEIGTYTLCPKCYKNSFSNYLQNCIELGCNYVQKKEAAKQNEASSHVVSASSSNFYEICPSCNRNNYIPSLGKCITCPYKKSTPLPSFIGTIYKKKCDTCKFREAIEFQEFCYQCKSKSLY